MSLGKFSAAAFVLTLFISASLSAQQVNTPYDYPVKPGTEEWKSFTSRDQKQEACQIPETVLTSLSTPALLETCLNYPLYADIMAYDHVQEGFDFVKSGFNGLQELLKREDVGSACVAKYATMYPDSIDNSWTPVQKGDYSLKFFSMEILLAQDEILAALSAEARLGLLREANNKLSAKRRNQEIFGLMGQTNNGLLMGRIMLRDNVAAFTKIVSGDPKMAGMFRGGALLGKENIDIIAAQARAYLGQE